MFAAIPTNIITGFLGAGKTTVISALLEQKPADENWAVLVNEFGEVAIDQALLGDAGDARELGQGVTIRDLPGGCLCCTMGVPFQVALNKLIKDSKPDRIVIEPTGLGHPAQLIDSLLQSPFDTVLDLRATLCLIDPDRFADPMVQANEIFIDQLMAADVVVLTKTDLAKRENIDGTRAGAKAIFPHKLAVVDSDMGRIDASLLDLARGDDRKMLYPDYHQHQGHDHIGHDHTQDDHGHDHHHHHDHHHADHHRAEDVETGVTAFPSRGDGPASCGWIFDREMIFDCDQLLDMAGGQDLPEGVERFKGAFRTERGWLSVNRAGQAFAFAPTSWRRDSRCELIMASGVNLDQKAGLGMLKAALRQGQA